MTDMRYFANSLSAIPLALSFFQRLSIGTRISHTIELLLSLFMDYTYIPQLVHRVNAMRNSIFINIDVDSLPIYKCTGKRFLDSVCYQTVDCSHMCSYCDGGVYSIIRFDIAFPCWWNAWRSNNLRKVYIIQLFPDSKESLCSIFS